MESTPDSGRPASGERSLVEREKHSGGRFGGFCFGGQSPDGVKVVAPLPAGTVFPNGARAALLLTFDVEGTYGNGTGDMALAFQAQGNQTLVTWTMEGDRNYLAKHMGLFMNMDKMMGGAFERGLAELKTIAEKEAQR